MLNRLSRIVGENLVGLSGIYCFLHRASGRCYIGSSINIHKRLQEHFYYARAGIKLTPFLRSLRSYGPDAFDVSILDRCGKDDLLSRERFYIALFDSASVNGFNSRPDPTANYDYRASDATRSRISASKKGRRPTADQRARQAAAQTGLKRSDEARARMSAAALGKVFSPEHRANISATRRRLNLSIHPEARQRGIENHQVPIAAVFADGREERFRSVVSAAAALGVCVATIRNRLAVGRPTKSGVSFRRLPRGPVGCTPAPESKP